MARQVVKTRERKLSPSTKQNKAKQSTLWLGELVGMFGLRITTQQDGPKSLPWFTFGWIGVLLFFFGWSQWGLSDQTQQVQQTREKFLCFYLKNDYTVVPESLKRHLPKVLRQHAARVEPYIEHYHRGGMAHDQARQWLRDGDGSRGSSAQTFRQDQGCLQQAMTSGLLREHPKKRIFVTLATLVPEDIVNNQRDMERLGQAYVQARSRHPWYGWGLVPADRNWFALFTAFLITPAWFTLLWQLLFLGLIGSFLEQRWGGPIWISLFVFSGLFGNILLLLFQAGSTVPLLGGHMALAGVMGMWTFATWQRPCSFWWRSASSSLQNLIFPAWSLTLVWLGLMVLDFIWLRNLWWLHLIPALFCFGLGCAAQWGMQYLDWLEPLPVIQPTKSGTPIQVPEREKPQPRAFKATQPNTGPKPKSLYLKPDLKQMVKTTYQQGEYDKAVEMYRELYKSGQARLEDFDELLLSCEKGQIAPLADDFLRAIRAAAFAKRPDKAIAYYHRCDNKRDLMPWSEREQISLVQELKRAGLYENARQELESILDQGPDALLFMDALLLKIEVLLEEGSDLEEAAQLIYKAGLYLEQQPQYRDAVNRLRIHMSEMDGSSIPEIRKIPMGLGTSLLDSGQTDAHRDQEVDTSLLADLDAFEQRLVEEENRPAPGQSWSELPMLILRRDTPDRPGFLDEDSSHEPPPITPIDDDFLLGEEPALSHDKVRDQGHEKPHQAFSTHPDSDQEGAVFVGQEQTNEHGTVFPSTTSGKQDTLTPDVPTPQHNPDFFASIEVSISGDMTASLESPSPAERQGTANAFATLADDDLLKNILEQQARLEQERMSSSFSPQQEREPFSAPYPTNPPWNESQRLVPGSDATPHEDLWHSGSPQERLDLFSPGKETSMVPSLSKMLGDGPIDPALLLGSEFEMRAALSSKPMQIQEASPVAAPSPTFPTSAASDIWKTDWIPAESTPPLADNHFVLPLFGEEENLQATRELSTILAPKEYAMAIPSASSDGTDSSIPVHPSISQGTTGQNHAPEWDLSVFEDMSSSGQNTEAEIPHILKPESLQGAHPISVVPPKGFHK